MKYIYILVALFTTLVLGSCQEEPTRTFFPHSTPVIESASISPTTFTYGDSLTITAKVSDPLTPLSTLEMKLVVNDKIIAVQSIRTRDNSTEVTAKFKTKFLSELPDNAKVEVLLDLINVEGDVTKGQVAGMTAKRKMYKQLYLVLDDNRVITLTPKKDGMYEYEALNLDLKNKIRYKIAEKLGADNQIDFTGDVWAFEDDVINVLGEKGDYITSSEPLKKNTTGIVFSAYGFTTKLLGPDLENLGQLTLAKLKDDVIYAGESFKEATFYIAKDKKIVIGADLQDAVFNMDYFKRISRDTVQYLGATGPIILDYSPTRKVVLVQELYPQAPTVLLLSGVGLGYPSKVKPGATVSWGFDQLLQFILFRNIGNNTYQGTVYLDAPNANFKFYENKGWGNEKKSDDYKLPAILINSATKGTNDGNWYAPTSTASGNYTITINLDTKVVTATPVTLP